MAGIAVVLMARDLDWKRVGMLDAVKVVVAVALMATKSAVLRATYSVGKSDSLMGNCLADERVALMAERKDCAWEFVAADEMVYRKEGKKGIAKVGWRAFLLVERMVI